jgi:hypothetical protein
MKVGDLYPGWLIFLLRKSSLYVNLLTRFTYSADQAPASFSYVFSFSFNSFSHILNARILRSQQNPILSTSHVNEQINR